MGSSNEELLGTIRYYQDNLNRYTAQGSNSKLLSVIEKLRKLPITMSHLQDTGVGRTVNALRKLGGDVGEAAKSLVIKWKEMVQAEDGNDVNSSEQTDNTHEDSKHSDGENSSHNASDTEKEISDKHKRDVYRHSNNSKESSHGHRSSHKKRSHDSESSEDELDSQRNDSSGFESEDEDVHKRSNSKSQKRYHSESSEEEVKEEKRHKSKKSKHSKESSDSEDTHRHHKSKSSRDESKSSRRESKSRREEGTSKSKEKTDSKRHDHRDHDDEKKSKHRKSRRDSDCEQKSSSKHKHSSKREHESPSETEEAKRKSKHEKESSKTKESKSHSSKSERHDKKDKKDEKHSHRKDDSYKHEEKRKSKDNQEEKKKERSSSSSGKSESKSSKSSSSEKKARDKEKVTPAKPVNSEKILNGIGSESGASFAEALGMCGPVKLTTKATSSTKKKPRSSSPEKSARSSSPEKSTRSSSPERQKSSSSASSTHENVKENVPSLLKVQPAEPLNINIASLLPEITPNYRALGFTPDTQPKRMLTQDEALSQAISNKNMRTKVYSGNKSHGKVDTLFDMCIRVLQENIDALEYTGGVPYSILKPILDKATPDQLFNMEHYNPYLIEDTDELWQRHCQRQFRNKKREEYESWREMYMRCLEEREARLNAITANIKQSQDKSTPVRTTKLAYVDSVVKPPRDVARKQAKNGIVFDKKPAQTPASRLSALATAGEAGKVAVPNPGPRAVERSSGGSSASASMKPKKAPLMAKTLSLFKNSFRR